MVLAVLFSGTTDIGSPADLAIYGEEGYSGSI
jgi:hypothetical protein